MIRFEVLTDFNENEAIDPEETDSLVIDKFYKNQDYLNELRKTEGVLKVREDSLAEREFTEIAIEDGETINFGRKDCHFLIELD